MENDPRIPLLKQLADPVRLRVIDRLSNDGATTVTRLAAELEVALPQLSNHLRRLRAAGLVRASRSGRQVVYELADPGLEVIPPLLDSITGRLEAGRPASPQVPSRTCYRHLGGRIGVSVYRALCERGALAPGVDGMVALGPAADEVLPALGVEPGGVPEGRRRFAFECLDATERAPHLAGALGDAIADALAQRGWTRQVGEGRVVELTAQGVEGLDRVLGVAL